MQPSRALPVLASLILAFALGGCAEKPSRLVGNERLIRGDEGFGTTAGIDTTVDRDTYVSPRTAFNEATLLAGREGAYEARSLFRIGSWALPDTTDTTLVIDSIRFELQYDAIIGLPPFPGVTLELWSVDAGLDSAAVAWPGPVLGTLLGSANPALLLSAPFQIEIGPASFTQVKSWAAQANSVSFALVPGAGDEVAGFVAGTGRFKIVSHRTVADTLVFSTTTSPVTNDLTIHTPVAPAPTGSETDLILGGLARSEVLLHATPPTPVQGFSVNEAHLVLYLAAPAPPSTDKLEIQAVRVGNAWSETAVADTGLGLATVPFRTLHDETFASASDSLLIPLPPSLVREWLLNPAANQGVLLRLRESYLHSAVHLFSRESASPPVIRIGTTSPPPGRF